MHFNFEQNNSEFKIRELLIKPTNQLWVDLYHSYKNVMATHKYVQVYKT